ncbi:MAG: hypothetical protein GF408_06295 [Candidatus Omnitrophica bacterium]|nr:hypothetical protein [Candidatus Omnitrophota bacterium]
MKYLTVIEVICDAADEEEAYHTAGEFLKGSEDLVVSMTCRTAPLQVK